MNSQMFLLNARDFAKGASLAVITAVVTWAYDAIQSGSLALTSETAYKVFQVAILAFVGYVLKNYLSDSQGKLFGRF